MCIRDTLDPHPPFIGHLASNSTSFLFSLYGSTRPRCHLRSPHQPIRLRPPIRRPPPDRSSSSRRRHRLLLLPALSLRCRRRSGSWRRRGFSARRTTRSEKPSQISAAASFRCPPKTLTSAAVASSR